MQVKEENRKALGLETRYTQTEVGRPWERELPCKKMLKKRL